MRGKITIQILETLGAMAVNSSDLCAAILSSGYGASASRLERRIIQQKRMRADQMQDDHNAVKQRYFMMLSRLKKDGLIEEKITSSAKLLVVTQKGFRKLAALKILQREKQWLPEPIYPSHPNNTLNIIAFDIPEKERWKRDWLRTALIGMDFSLIQKSVWIGKTKIPEKFLRDLSKLRIIDFVEIFEISKTGSLQQIT